MVVVALDENGKEKFRTVIVEIRITGNMFQVLESGGVTSDSADTIDGAVVSLLEKLE